MTAETGPSSQSTSVAHTTESALPLKRALDAPEHSHKRQNTGMSSKTDGEPMDIEEDASEGEVVESPLPHPQAKASVPIVSMSESTTPVAVAQPSKSLGAQPAARLTPAQMAEKAKMLKAKFLEQRARQKALQEGLPALDAEVKRTEETLEQQHAQLDETLKRVKALEAEIAQTQERALQLREAIARSEEQLRAGQAGRTRFAEELQSLTNQQPPKSKSSPGGETVNMPVAHTPDSNGIITSNSDANGQGTLLLDLDAAKPQDIPALAHNGLIEDEVDQVVPHTAIESVGNSTDSAQDEVEDQEVVDEHETPQLDPNSQLLAVPTGSVDVGLVTETADQEAAEVASDGSASMSDSASEAPDVDEQDEGEYEPPEEDATQPMEIDDGSSDEYEPQDSPVGADSNMRSHDGLTSEMPSAEEGELSTYSTPAVAPTSEVVDPGPNPNDSFNLLGPDDPADTLAVNDGPRQPNYNNKSHSSWRNPPTGPSDRSQRSTAMMRPLLNDERTDSAQFSAYKSPLRSLPLYRYHAQFDNSASDGYRSLTYSNSIDPKVPLCPTELAGETCQDAQCEEQHFRHLGLSGEREPS
jgi:hypothetical protein